jgi:uncharacterized protein (TIGR03067 family)
MTATLLLLASLLPADASAPVDGPPLPSAVAVADLGELEGEWAIVSCVRSRIDSSMHYRGDRWVFVGGSVFLRDAIRGPGNKVSFHADPTATPARIEVSHTAGRPVPGIYRLVGEELLWAEDLAGRNRPSSFEPADGVVVWKLRRVEK